MKNAIANILPIIVTAVVTTAFVIGMQTHAAVRAEVVPQGMELVSRSTDKVISKYVDHDADTICYVVNGPYLSSIVAISCLNR